MKRVALALVVGCVIGGGLAWALPDAEPWVSVNEQRDHKKPARFNRETYFEFAIQAVAIDAGDVSANGVTATTLTVGTRSFTPRGRGTLVYDFPSLGGTGASQPGDTICADSSTVTVTGCAFGDQLIYGMDQVRVNSFIKFEPYMTGSGTAVVQACCVGITDGGSCNQPDASYTVTCIR